MPLLVTVATAGMLGKGCVLKDICYRASQSSASCGPALVGVQGRASAGAGAQDLASEPIKQSQTLHGALAPQPALHTVPGPGQAFGVAPGPGVGVQHMSLPAAPQVQAGAPAVTASPVPGPQVLLKPSFFEASQESEEGQEPESLGQQQFHFQPQADARPSAPPPPSSLHATPGSTHRQAPRDFGSVLQPLAALSMGAPAGLASAAPVLSPHSAAPSAASHFLSSILLRGDSSAPALPGPSPPVPAPQTGLSQNGDHMQKQFNPHLITQQQQQVASPGVPRAASESAEAARAVLPASHGAPFLQPFPPPVPPASLTHPPLPRPHSLGSGSTLTITREGLKSALLRLVQVRPGSSQLPIPLHRQGPQSYHALPLPTTALHASCH